jgi:hypothetical protein
MNELILNKMKEWINNPIADYQEGRSIIESIPEERLTFLQLHQIETYESRMRICMTFQRIININK